MITIVSILIFLITISYRNKLSRDMWKRKGNLNNTEFEDSILVEKNLEIFKINK